MKGSTDASNPLSGPYTIARLLVGLEIDKQQLAQVAPAWQTIAQILAQTPQAVRLAAFDTLLQGLPEGSTMRQMVFQMNPAGPLPQTETVSEDALVAGNMPELPEAAHLPEEWADPQAGAWLRRYLDFASQAAPMTDAAFHLSVGLALLSIAVARRVYLPISVLRLFPNLYQLIVAPSTLYHKTTALRMGETLLKKAGLDILLLPSRMTPESLVNEMGVQRPQTYSDWTDEEKCLWLRERTFFAQRGWLMDEASNLLNSFNRDYTAGLLPLVLSFYECPDREAAQTIGRGRQAVSRSYLTILGATTPAALGANLKRNTHWANGFWPRFCLTTPQAAIPDWRFFPEPTPISNDLSQPLNHLAFKILPMPRVLDQGGEVSVKQSPPLNAQLDPVVRQAWEAYAKALGYDLLLEGGLDGRLWPAYGRLAIHAMKAALLLATSDWAAQPNREHAPRVMMGHWYLAQNIAESWRASIHRLLDEAATGEERSREETLLHILHRFGRQGMTVRQLGIYAHLPRAEVESALITLEQDGLVERFQPQGRKVYLIREASLV